MGIEAPPISQIVGVGPSCSESVVKRAAITSAAGAFDVVAAVTGKRIRVLSFKLCTTTTAVAITWRSNASTALTGAMTVIANTPWGAEWHPAGHFETASGEKLDILQSGTSQISGWLTYQEVDPLD